MRIKSLLVSMLASASIGTADAALLIDWSPDTAGASVGCCVAQGQETYLQHFDLTQATTLTGFAYYTEHTAHAPAVGNTLFVTIAQATFQNGQPTVFSAYYFLPVPVTSNNFPGATASNYGNFYGLTGIFAPLPSVQLAPGAYWIGLNGDASGFAPATFGFALLNGQNAPFNDAMPQLDTIGRITVSQSAPVGTLAMRLYGDAVTVPEPGTLALLAGSVALLSLIGRRRQPAKLPKN